MTMKLKNRHFGSYAAYLNQQVRKVRAERQAKKGGLEWEYRVQRSVKPRLVSWMAEFRSPMRTRRVLVLGARWGADVWFLREHGYRCSIDALDLYDPPLSSLVRVGDAHQLEETGLPLNSVDLVWAYHVIEHLWSPSFVLQDLQRFVRQGGHMFVAMPDFGVSDKYDAQDEYINKAEWEKLTADCNWGIAAYQSYAVKGKKRPAHFYILVKHGP